MNLCVLSGKGGAGKTSVSVNLAVLLRADYYDCDVEEPNGFVFLRPNGVTAEQVLVSSPIIDELQCTLCGHCVESCQFGALVNTKKDIMVFSGLCHGCRACGIACSHGAISYEKRPIGVIERGVTRGIRCARGLLNVGEHMGVPVIRRLLTLPEPTQSAILDCSPGTSCNVVNTLRHADAIIIVVEPTAFGLHDMTIVLDLVKSLDIPCYAVINKSRGDDEAVYLCCKENGVKVLGSIPFSRSAAEAYSRGELLSDMPSLRGAFDHIASGIKEVLPWNW